MKSTELLVRDSSARPRCWWYFASRPNEPPRKFLRLRRASDHHELNTKCHQVAAATSAQTPTENGAYANTRAHAQECPNWLQ